MPFPHAKVFVRGTE